MAARQDYPKLVAIMAAARKLVTIASTKVRDAIFVPKSEWC
jgi:hypothetical protein